MQGAPRPTSARVPECPQPFCGLLIHRSLGRARQAELGPGFAHADLPLEELVAEGAATGLLTRAEIDSLTPVGLEVVEIFGAGIRVIDELPFVGAQRRHPRDEARLAERG